MQTSKDSPYLCTSSYSLLTKANWTLSDPCCKRLWHWKKTDTVKRHKRTLPLQQCYPPDSLFVPATTVCYLAGLNSSRTDTKALGTISGLITDSWVWSQVSASCPTRSFSSHEGDVKPVVWQFACLSDPLLAPCPEERTCTVKACIHSYWGPL